MNQTVPTINNTAVVVVTYNPGKDFIENIRRHIKVASLVIVVDNNSDNKDYLRYLTESNGIVFIEQDRNTGIAEALNIGIKRGLAEGKEWILTLDDDTEFVYRCTDLYSPEYDSGILWNDETLNIDWKFEEFGINTVKLTAVPSMCEVLNTKELFLDILDEIDGQANSRKTRNRKQVFYYPYQNCNGFLA